MRDNEISVHRNIKGAVAAVEINDVTDAALVAAARRAERILTQENEKPSSDLINRLPLEPYTTQRLFSDATYQLDADKRAASAIDLAERTAQAGMLSAGYIEVAAVGTGIIDTLGRTHYYSYTTAQYSITVRDPKGTGSGWTRCSILDSQEDRHRSPDSSRVGQVLEVSRSSWLSNRGATPQSWNLKRCLTLSGGSAEILTVRGPPQSGDISMKVTRIQDLSSRCEMKRRNGILLCWVNGL